MLIWPPVEILISAFHIAAHIEDPRKNLHVLSGTMEDHEQIIMYSNQDPVLASGMMIKQALRTESPPAISHSNLSSTTPPGVVGEIILPAGAIAIERDMIAK